MEAWNKWFALVADKSVENGGFHGGAREISHDGTKDLPMAMDSITGYSIIAVPTGIITAELSKKKKPEDKSGKLCCEDCGCENHDTDASYCKVCGKELGV